MLAREPVMGRFGPVRVRQLVALQVAAGLVLAAWVVHERLLVPASVVAFFLVLVALTRWGGRPLPEWLGGALALRRRRRAAAPVLERDVSAGLVPVVECAPRLRCHEYAHRDGRRIGVVGDETFLTAVVRVERRDAALRGGRGEHPLPLGPVYDALEVDGIRLESAQVVQHTQPAPAPTLPPQAVAALSYGPLQRETGVPAARLTWVALKLDPERCREAVDARGGGVDGAQRALARVADQVASRLTGAGFRTTVLTEDELVAALATSAAADPLVTAQAGQPDATPVRRTAESARAWRCDDRWHTVYGIGRWPELGSGGSPLPEVAAALSALPALATTLSLTLARGPHEAVAITGHVRVTACGEAELAALRQQVEQAARGAGVALTRLDHEQVPGVLASLPLGGVR
ncbi:type VII secretion protein EccE [Streptomyces sp. JJ66]|uniref:type VII secretion protein EccE n=1 Tax=Streptomyces sp. JJ66 TaxID=2803843 RepID=UPI0027E2F318|nr:type VII secretion protein EccE [Streptomyces sp. JJ66]